MNNADGQQALTTTGSTAPQTRYNAPGKTTLTYNVGYTNTLRNMLAGLSREAQLNKLNLDAYEDWSIALLHSWAIVLDVLAFYQERIINEGYLLTATEPRSILELARTIGYELDPAMAASTDLALTVAPDADGQPQRVEISAEKLRLQPMAIQSTPTEGKLPQIFEIAEPIVPFVARTEWNTLLPSTELTADAMLSPIIYPNQTTIRLAGVRNDLQPDDTLLLIGDDAPTAQADPAASATNASQTGQQWHLRKLKTVKTEPLKGYTLITWHHERYLFQLDAKLAKELDEKPQSDEQKISDAPREEPEKASNPPTNQKISAKLRDEFTKAGHPLADGATKDILQAGSNWVIDENEGETKFNRHYIIKFENQTLAVYEDIDKLTKPLYNPQFFIFRQKAQLFGYAKGAVYYAAEEAPTAKEQSKPAMSSDRTNGPAQPAASDPASVEGKQAASKPTAVEGVGSNTKNGGSVGTVTTETAPPQPTAATSQTKPTWTPHTLGLPGGETGEINALVANPQGILFAATKQDVFRLDANAESWRAVATGLVQRNITALALSNDNEKNVLYAGSSTGGIYRSADNGDNWTPMSGDTVARDATVEKDTKDKFSVVYTEILPKAPVLVLEAFGTSLYAGTDEGIFLSADQGRSWEKQPGDKPAPAAVTPVVAGENMEGTAPCVEADPGFAAKVWGWLKSLGLNFWGFVKSPGPTLPIAAPILALAVAQLPKLSVAGLQLGKEVAVIVGTGSGQFRLPGNVNRWVVAAMILGLTMVWNFAEGKPVPLHVSATGSITLASSQAGNGNAGTDAPSVGIAGASTGAPSVVNSQPLTAPVELNGNLSFSSNISNTSTLSATALLMGTSGLTPTSTTVTVTLAATRELALTSGLTFTGTLDALGSMTATGLLTVAPSRNDNANTLVTFVATAGTLAIDPSFAITQPLTAPVKLNGNLSFSSQNSNTSPLTTTALLTATGDWMVAGTTVTVTLAATGDLTLTPGLTFSDTLDALVNVTANASLTVAPSSTISGAQVATATLEITSGMLTAAAGGDSGNPWVQWLVSIWKQIFGLVRGAIEQAMAAVQTYWQALQEQMPQPLKSILGWVYTNIVLRILQPLVDILQTTLLQPLVAQTSDMLARMTLVTLAVLALLLGWQYTDHYVSNRKTVPVDATIHALVISAKDDRVFVGTEKGVYRSVKNDPQTPKLTAIARVLARNMFTGREMESVNEGLRRLNMDNVPDVRALTFDASGNLLAGTTEGRVFRYLQISEPSSFPVDSGAVNEIVTELNKCGLPEALRKQFSSKGKPLTNETKKTKVEQKGRLWSLEDAGALYLIRKQGQTLTVYLDYQWEEYGNVPVLAAVGSIVAMKDGVFIAGKPAEQKVEDQWFTTQLEKSLVDLDQVYDELEPAYRQPGGRWLLLQQREELAKAAATDDSPDKAKPTTRQQGVLPSLFSIHRVDPDPVLSKEFAQARPLSRLTVKGVDGTEPLPLQLSRLVRSKTDVLLQSQPLTLYDNRPVAGEQIRLDRYVAGLAADQRLAVSGKVMHVRVAKGKQGQGLLLDSKDSRIEPQELKPDERLVVLSYQSQQTTTTQQKNDGQPTIQTDSAQPKTQKPLWRLKRQDGFEGSLDHAEEGQLVWDLPTDEDPLVSEIAIIKEVSPGLVPTVIDLQQPLQHVYDRATVTLCANVVKATHGQTMQDEILGNGTGALPNEQFTLPQKPLTFISAETPTGYASTLKVLVQGIEWHETKSLYKLDAGSTKEATGRGLSQGRSAFDKRNRGQRVYLLRQDDEQNSIVRFGDGKKGTRLPTGIEQVTAVYRVGSGLEGNVPANTINQPQTLPSAIPVVTNPVPSSGGVTPEPKEQAQRNAPLATRTLEAIVSQTDYEDFVRQFSGIGRVQITKEYTIDGRKVLELAVTDMDGNKIPDNSDLVKKLISAIDKQRVSKIPEVRIISNEPLYFNVEVCLLIEPDHAARRDEIVKTIKDKMREQFSFKQRQFGQTVDRSELIALIHSVAGIEWVQELKLWPAKKDEEKDLNVQFIPGLLGQMLLLNPQKVGITITILDALKPLASDTAPNKNATQVTPKKATV